MLKFLFIFVMQADALCCIGYGNVKKCLGVPRTLFIVAFCSVSWKRKHVCDRYRYPDTPI